MYDTSPLTPFKGETKPFLHVEFDNKALDSLFDLHPSLENSFDFSEFVPVSGCVVATEANSPPGVPDSAVVNSPVASSADLHTLSSADLSEHLERIERQSAVGGTSTTTTASDFVHQQASPGPVVPSTPSPVSHHQHQHHHHHQQPLTSYQSALSPSLTADDGSQAFSDDSCVFMPEYDQLANVISSAAHTTTTSQAGGQSGVAGAWGSGESFFSTVKTEDMGITACMEATLPGFTSTSTPASTSYSDVGCKMEYEAGTSTGHYGGGVVSPSRSSSMRTLSESSSATTSTFPDSPRRVSKGGSKRRQIPKGSEEYKEKRARNNVAVRKSRAKAKQKQKMTEGRVKELMDHNDALTKKVEMLTKELTVLRGLFVNVGATLPDDLSKLLEQS